MRFPVVFSGGGDIPAVVKVVVGGHKKFVIFY